MEKPSELSRELQWFNEILRTKFLVNLMVTEVRYESMDLAVEEVTEFFVPLELPVKLLETILYEVMIINHAEGYVWLEAVVYYLDSPDWFLQAVTKIDWLFQWNVLSKLLSE